MKEVMECMGNNTLTKHTETVNPQNTPFPLRVNQYQRAARQENGILKYGIEHSYKGHLSNEDSAYYPSYIEMCTKLPLK